MVARNAVMNDARQRRHHRSRIFIFRGLAPDGMANDFARSQSVVVDREIAGIGRAL